MGWISERSRAGVRAYGGHRPIFRGDYSNDEKIYIRNTPLPLDGPRLTTAHTTTNQKKSSTTEGSMEGRCDEREACGKYDTIVVTKI